LSLPAKTTASLAGLLLVASLGCSAANGGKEIHGEAAAQSTAPLVAASSPNPSSLEALRRGLAPVTPESSPLKDIYFDFDRYDLKPEARRTLQLNAEWLKQNSAAQIEIEGHTDDWGSNEYNLALGAKRALSARDYLVTLGVDAERLRMVSYGEEAPGCLERTEACREKNRRARFVILAPLPAN
jgi:peptidoglycan-associated lipoprotein